MRFSLLWPLFPIPKLLADLSAITLVGDHPDDIKMELQPFMVMDGLEEYCHAAHEIARSYSLLSECDNGVTFADLDKFMLPKELRAHPTSFSELKKLWACSTIS
jgi:hypothetical protein